MILPPIILDEEADNVVELNAPFKRREQARQFERVPLGKCLHYAGQVTYQIDEKLADVTCGGCGEKLNPMFVLAQLMNRESRYAQFRAEYQEEMKRLNERSRTKCQHCGEMTRISKN
jgi:hypothetical protein